MNKTYIPPCIDTITCLSAESMCETFTINSSQGAATALGRGRSSSNDYYDEEDDYACDDALW